MLRNRGRRTSQSGQGRSIGNVALIFIGFGTYLILTLLGLVGGCPKRSRSFLDNGLSLRSDDFLWATIQFCVFDESVAIGKPGSALGTTISLFSLKRKISFLSFSS